MTENVEQKVKSQESMEEKNSIKLDTDWFMNVHAQMNRLGPYNPCVMNNPIAKKLYQEICHK